MAMLGLLLNQLAGSQLIWANLSLAEPIVSASDDFTCLHNILIWRTSLPGFFFSSAVESLLSTEI